MSTILAPTRVAAKPMPFLLANQFNIVGDIVVVPDDNWDEIVAMLGRDNTIVETEKGPFMVVTQIPPEMKEVLNEKA